ncbi:MAG: PQQ-binding-like beta-propeller repeat protein [Gammaproteobacteria bacterium]|nr:PQQ-binding-like beta-propeller repeat protein [Gammaproteobacteria bacterium]
MVAAKETIFITGSLAQTEKLSTFALDASEGALLWRLPRPVSSLFATSAALYVGSYRQISAHDLRTGQTLWTASLPLITRNVAYLLVVDNLIYARSSTAHLLRADTGEVIMNFTEGPLEATLQKWQIQANPEYFSDFADITLTQDTKFIRGVAEFRGDGVRAVDRQTGEILWQMEDGIISNVAATETVLYLLRRDRRLLGLDTRTGKVVTSVQFEPSPITSKDVDRGFMGGYYVAVDKEAGRLYAYLGDSAQLFAFKIVDDAEP